MNSANGIGPLLFINCLMCSAAELFITLQDSANTEYACMKANVTHNGTTAFGNVYGVVNTGSSDLATITYTISGGSVLVQAVSSGGVTAATVQYSLSA